MITYITQQWLFWSFMGGFLSGVLFLFLYSYKLQHDRKPKRDRRDALLKQLTQHSFNGGNNVDNNSKHSGDCSVL